MAEEDLAELGPVPPTDKDLAMQIGALGVRTFLAGMALSSIAKRLHIPVLPTVARIVEGVGVANIATGAILAVLPEDPSQMQPSASETPYGVGGLTAG